MLDFTKELCPDRPLIHPTSQTKNCRFGRYVEIGDHCVLEETEVGDYTYCFGSNDIIYTALGKFNSIATGVRINPVQHPAKIRAAAHHFTYRCSHYGLGPDDAALIDWRRQNHRVVTGNDVWLGHNAVLMGGVTLGDGAVVGAGAVVGNSTEPCWPCGACRQMLYEFAPGLTVLVAQRDHSFVKLPLSELLTHGFGPKSLG